MITNVGFICIVFGLSLREWVRKYYIRGRSAAMVLPLSPIRIDSLKKLYQPFGVDVSVLRLDLIHPVVSGNKWFKLGPALTEATANGKRTVITFGGAWSNHLVATAAACAASGVSSIGIVRGEEPPALSATLADARVFGMRLVFVSRGEYATKEIPSALRSLLPDALVIGEGGRGPFGREGAARIAGLPHAADHTHLVAAVGTGTTLAGLVAGATGQVVTGIPVLRDESLANAINALLPPALHNRFTLVTGFAGGGYAKSTPGLLRFMNDWFDATGIPTDFVYTGKLFLAVDQLVRRGHFSPGSRVLIIHSGGLQGNRSLPPGTLNF
jgi:1-aminocyclopropane-1-carboxylate deaminase